MKLTGNLPIDDMIARGPVINVDIEVTSDVEAALLAAGQAVPPPMTIKMMIDTGAQITVIEDAIANQLGVRAARYSSVVGVSQQVQPCAIYRMIIALEMTDDAGKKRVVAVESEAAGVSSPAIPHQHVGLLGRDFLRDFRFIYEGDTGSFELIFPAPQSTK